jgi:amidase
MDIEQLQNVKTSPWASARIPGQFVVEEQLLASLKRSNRQQESIGKTAILESRDYDITDSTATQLVANLQSGKWKAEWVALAFIKRSSIAYQLTMGMSEMMFGKGLTRARELDDIFAKTGPVGPLHGVVISLNDAIDVEGVDTSMGYPMLCLKPKTKDAALVKHLKELGCVLLYKTNQPTLIYNAFDGNNPIFGQCTNPWNPTLSPGSGDGAMQSCHSSIYSFGVDFDGGARISAAFSGVYCIKPTLGTLPFSNSPIPGVVQPIISPMCSSVDGLQFLMSLLTNSRIAVSKLNRVAYYDDNGVYSATPPVKNCLARVVQTLKAQSIECIEWKPPKLEKMYEIAQALQTADGGQTLRDVLAGFPLDVYPKPIHNHLLLCSSSKSVQQVWKLQGELSRLVDEFWNAWDFDVLICPPCPLPGLPIGTSCPSNIDILLPNLVNAAAGTVPMGYFSDKDGKSEIYTKNDIEKAIHDLYNASMDSFIGAPLCVQVVGRFEKDVLSAMRHLSLMTLPSRL